MSAEHKRLLRLAARRIDAASSRGERVGLGMCYALNTGSKSDLMYAQCANYVSMLYRSDSPIHCNAFWMGAFDTKHQQHRIMALLFAAECFDDMEGV